MTVKKVHIDGDVLAYRSAWSADKDTEKDAVEKVDELMSYVLAETTMMSHPDEYDTYLTGKGNYRYDVAVSYVYKGNRPDAPKPRYLDVVREHLVQDWGAFVSYGEEADDLIAKAATAYGPEAVIVSIDKDFLQVPCKHYNPTTGQWTEVDTWGGLVNFYSQILTGDRVDNIVGLWRVGPVKAAGILEGATTEQELFQKCLDAYDGDYDRVLENGRLLWLRRYEDELWEPPSGLSPSG